MHRNRLVLIIIGLALGTALPAQWSKGITLEGTFHVGKIIKHTPKLLYDPPAFSSGFDLNLSYQTFGKRSWHQLQDYPRFGLGLFYYNLGDHDLMGQALAFCPNLTIYLTKKKKFDARFQVGSGVAYLTKKFDRLTNPTNNSIGSNVNNITHFKFFAGYQFSPRWLGQAGVSLTHFSNGAAQLPNFGVNIAALTLGLHYSPQPLKAEDYVRHDVDKKRTQKWGLTLYLGRAYKEIQAQGGPRYPIHIAGINAGYHLNKINRLQAGFEYEFNRAVYFFGKNVFAFNSEKEARQLSSRWMFFVGDEFMFGNISITLQAGVYLGQYYLNGYPIYNKLRARYYFPAIGKPKGRFYVGVTLKSHLSIAEYIAFGGGVTF